MERRDREGEGRSVSDTNVIASFIGCVNIIREDAARVSLKNEQSGEEFDAECASSHLKESSIGEEDEFRVEVVRSKEGASIRFIKLIPKTIAKERLHEIFDKYKDRWKFAEEL